MSSVVCHTNHVHLSVYLDIETLGLNAYEQKITCICAIVDDNKGCCSYKAFFGSDERDVLRHFVKFMKEIQHLVKEVVTWNGKSFDMPYLKMRCLKHGLMIRPDETLDVKLMFPEFEIQGKWRRPSLAETGKFLGIELAQKDKFDGKDAITLAKLGMYKELSGYCMNDCRLLRAIRKRAEQ
jgi:uncharacterized protein YprB with RNaseH-like and TPR domain